MWDPSGQPAYEITHMEPGGVQVEPGCTPHMGPIWMAHLGPIYACLLGLRMEVFQCLV